MSRSYPRSRLLVRLACGWLLVCCPWIFATAGVTLEQVQLDRQQQLRQALEQGSLEGQFIEQTPGDYVFAPARGDLPGFRVANPQAIGSLASGPWVNLRGAVQEDGRVSVSGYSLTTTNTEGLQFPQVQGATKLLRESLEAAIKPGAMNESSRSFGGISQIETNTRKGIAEVVGAYTSLIQNEASPTQVTELVREWLRLRQQIVRTYTDSDEGKAIYDDPDNYAPWRYERIYRQSPAVVAIGAPGASRPRCSGILIASDLVLTAGHCFAVPHAAPPKEMEAWFGYFAGPGDKEPAVVERIPIAGMVAPRTDRLGDVLGGRFGPNLLDYVVVALSKPPSKDADGKPTSPQCVRKVPLYKGDAVYVMGFPEGRLMTVHDSARVYLPFRILDGYDFYKLRLDIHADLLGLPSYDQSQRDQFMKEFDASYVSKQEDDLSWRFLHHVEDGGEPRMGIVSDTFRGNSGGPVYERERNQCVVGILVAGSPDTGVRRTANWREHERVLPLASVIEDLEKDEQTRGLVEKIRVE